MQPKKKIKKYKYDFHFKQILELEKTCPRGLQFRENRSVFWTSVTATVV